MAPQTALVVVLKTQFCETFTALCSAGEGIYLFQGHLSPFGLKHTFSKHADHQAFLAVRTGLLCTNQNWLVLGEACLRALVVDTYSGNPGWTGMMMPQAGEILLAVFELGPLGFSLQKYPYAAKGKSHITKQRWVVHGGFGLKLWMLI